MAMTPRSRSLAPSEDSLTSAPRSLNELVTWRFSYLTKTSAPVSADSFGAGSMGVRSTAPAIVARAASISLMEMVKLSLRSAALTMPQDGCRGQSAGRRRGVPPGLRFGYSRPISQVSGGTGRPKDLAPDADRHQAARLR